MESPQEQFVGTQFNQGIAVAQACGIGVRFEYLHGRGGGVCQIRQQPQFFVDLALDPLEQLQALEEALRVVVLEEWPLPQREPIQNWLNELSKTKKTIAG